MKGRVKWWNSKEGYGFIEYENENNIFVHIENKDLKKYKLDENQEIEFTTIEIDNCTYLHELKLVVE